MVFRFILTALLVYFLVRFVFNFLIPILRFRSSAKSKFREMNDFYQQQNQQQNQKTEPNKAFKKDKKVEGEYIDYEEV